MTNNCLLKLFFTFAGLFFISSYIFSQDCLVEYDSLKGTYTGDCKKGKANGHGKAVGTDAYEGEFKSGLPAGEGTYTWKNGNVYKGKFEKGLKEGKGVMTYKRPDLTDSVIEGFWKNDIYVGKYEKPFKIIFRSKNITDVRIRTKMEPDHKVTFWISSTTGGTFTLSQGYIEKPTIRDIQLIRGSYTIILDGATYPRKTESILKDVSYPLQMRVTIASEVLEVVLLEESSYHIEVKINS